VQAQKLKSILNLL